MARASLITIRIHCTFFIARYPSCANTPISCIVSTFGTIPRAAIIVNTFVSTSPSLTSPIYTSTAIKSLWASSRIQTSTTTWALTPIVIAPNTNGPTSSFAFRIAKTTCMASSSRTSSTHAIRTIARIHTIRIIFTIRTTSRPAH